MLIAGGLAPTRAVVPVRRAGTGAPRQVASSKPVAVSPALPTVEIIRGDKRAQEVVSQE
jgi:hypothetical protein